MIKFQISNYLITRWVYKKFNINFFPWFRDKDSVDKEIKGQSEVSSREQGTNSYNISLELTFSTVPRWVVLPCQNRLEKPFTYPIMLLLYLKPGCQHKDPYPNTHNSLLPLFIISSILSTFPLWTWNPTLVFDRSVFH